MILRLLRLVPKTLPLALLALASCSTLRSSWIRPDYPQHDRTEVIHLAVVTWPAPGGEHDACALMSLVARRYTNQKRDFIAKLDGCQDARPKTCPEGIDGLLLLHPTRAERSDEQVRLAVEGELLRCSDFEPIWRGRAKGHWPTTDPKLKELASSYVGEIGPEVRPWVPATFRLLRALLDSLPRPAILGEDLLLEKIELGE